jgi:hypothetical protein
MSKTKRFGWEGFRGEVPALRESEDLRGNPEPYGVDDTYDEGPPECVYLSQAPWTDPDFLQNAYLPLAVESELNRCKELHHTPFLEWPEADQDRMVAFLRG